MIDQTSQFFAILTNVGVAKQANADALGIAWKITQMGVGDANGADPIPSATQTTLINERRRAPLNQLKVDPANSAVIIAEQVIPAEVGGWWIREIGLYDADNDLVAIANCAPSFKPLLTQGSGRTQVVRMNLVVSNASSVELKIDPSVVLATRAYVDQKVLEELNKQDFKHSALVATTAPIVLNGLQTIDGVAVTAGKRVLVKDQAAGRDNGLYLASAVAWTRTEDADVSAEITPGLFVHIEQGATGGDSIWQLTTDAPIVLGTTALTFEMIVGRTGVTAGTYRSVTVEKNGRVIGATNPTTLAGNGITDAYTKAEVEAMIAQASALPVGAQVSFPVNKVPPGFLERDGSVKSIALYPDLATFLGGAFNRGDEGAGNFRLPESRGEFERGWDHGRGADVDRALGSFQEASYLFDAVGQLSAPNRMAGQVQSDDAAARVTRNLTIAQPSTASTVASYVDTGRAVRPRNVAVVMCIKAWNAPINQGNIDIAALAAIVDQLGVRGPMVGASGARMNVTAASATATFTADEVVLQDAGGKSYRIKAFNQTINLASAVKGLGAMDVGAAPVNGYVALYALFNPATNLRSLMAVNSTAVIAPSLCAGVIPAGYSASALLTVVATDATGQFKPVSVEGRQVTINAIAAYGGNSALSAVPVSLAGAVPLNAVQAEGFFAVSSSANGTISFDVYATATGMGLKRNTASLLGGGTNSQSFEKLPIVTPQLAYLSTSNSTGGTPTYNLNITGYTL